MKATILPSSSSLLRSYSFLKTFEREYPLSPSSTAHSLAVPCTGHKDTVSDIDFNCDGKLVATASYDATVKIWESQTGKLLQTLEGPGDSIDVSCQPTN